MPGPEWRGGGRRGTPTCRLSPCTGLEALCCWLLSLFHLQARRGESSAEESRA